MLLESPLSFRYLKPRLAHRLIATTVPLCLFSVLRLYLRDQKTQLKPAFFGSSDGKTFYYWRWGWISLRGRNCHNDPWTTSGVAALLCAVAPFGFGDSRTRSCGPCSAGSSGKCRFPQYFARKYMIFITDFHSALSHRRWVDGPNGRRARHTPARI